MMRQPNQMVHHSISVYTGPKFHQHILDILLRFQYHQIAVTADIEKAFLMISVAKQD